MKCVFGVNGMRYEIEDEDGFSVVSVNKGLDFQHIIRTFTFDIWIVPGLIPEVDANSIKMMDENKRRELIDNVSKHGDILKFVPNEDEITIGNLSLNSGLVRFFSNSENIDAVAVSAIGVNWLVHHPILAGAAIYVSWKG